ncbi:MAG TPA: T9SS type A sorting domain-containing protein [Bacteroidia bacterium]|nr:T9SS type A sorting domain-containing protein [Bacteroidia bacterium]
MNGVVWDNFKCANGDLLMLGINNGADIDPGPGINTSGPYFFARYSPAGNLIFGHPCSYTAYPQLGWLVNDADDNFYIVYMNAGFYDLDTIPGSGEFTLAGLQQAFVKFDGMGHYKWSLLFPGNVYVMYSTVLSDKSVVITGWASNSPADLDPGPGVYIFDPQNTTEGFLAKFDSSGNFITAREFHTSTGFSQEFILIQQMKSDHNNNVYLTGYFVGTVDFDPGPGIHNLHFFTEKYFLLKLDSALNFVYAYKYPKASFDIMINNNNVFLEGSAEDSADIDPTSNVCLIYPGGSFIAKLLPNAGIQWVKTIQQTQGTWITVNGFENDGSIYCTFNFSDSVTQNSFGLPNIHTPPYEVCMAKLDSNGSAVFYFDLNGSLNLQNSRVLFSDPSHFFYSGRLNGPTDVEIGPGIYNMAPAWSNEFFLSFYSLDVQMNRINGNAFIDLNGNAIAESNENGAQNAIVEIASANTMYVSTDNNGDYGAYVPAGNYSISVPTFPASLSGPVPLANSANFPFSNQIDTANNFAFGVVANEIDVSATITGFGNARPGFDMDYNITYTNIGSTVQSGVVEVQLDSILTFVSSGVTPSNINGNILQWNYSSLNPFQSSNIDLVVTVSSNAQIGDTIVSTTNISPVAGDAFPVNNYDTSRVIITGSEDPNFKEVNPSGDITTTEVSSGTYLTYTIHFQNTGNDTAFNVTILDTLSVLLDIPSFNLLASSHPCQFTLYPGNLAEFKFRNILLPDSNINEHRSHGFVKYKVKPLSTLIAGDQVKNNAAIYFDFNQPVLTNTAMTEIVLPTGISSQWSVVSSQLAVYPNPAREELTINSYSLSGKNAEIKIYDLFGREVFQLHPSSGGANLKLQTKINVSGFSRGIYLIQLKSGEKTARAKFVKQ